MLADDFDSFWFDLDGVVYLGDQVIPAAPDTLGQLRRQGRTVGFVTNNAGRSPDSMAESLRGMGIGCDAGDVVTSAQAIVAEMAGALEPGSAVLVVGSDFLADETRRAGLRVVVSADEHPAAVVQGWGRNLDQPLLLEGCLALEGDARWFVSNTDLTIPGDRGIGPGSGSFVRLIAGVTKREPDVIAGKPHGPLFEAARARFGGERPVFVGDRLDTDVEGAKRAGLATVWVLTGAHGKEDLLKAAPEQRPDHVAADIGGLLRPALSLDRDGDRVRCGNAVATLAGHDVAVDQGSDPVAALWALAQLAWEHPEADATKALASLPLP